MALPDRDEALGWLGKTVVDRDGAKLGRCTAVFTDDATGVPEWVGVRLGAVMAFVPLLDAEEAGGRVRVGVKRDQVLSAPLLGSHERISEDQEAVLYRHYGIEHSRAASASLLPAGVTPPKPGPVAAMSAHPRAAGAVVLAGLGLVLGAVLVLRRLRNR
jgi:hypothetical protein